jgi:hypothetical protein
MFFSPVIFNQVTYTISSFKSNLLQLILKINFAIKVCLNFDLCKKVWENAASYNHAWKKYPDYRAAAARYV